MSKLDNFPFTDYNGLAGAQVSKLGHLHSMTINGLVEMQENWLKYLDGEKYSSLPGADYWFSFSRSLMFLIFAT